jgi:hypothetical protein
MAEPATAVAAAGSDIIEAHDIAVSFEGLAAIDGVTLACQRRHKISPKGGVKLYHLI